MLSILYPTFIVFLFILQFLLAFFFIIDYILGILVPVSQN